jgi:hypothetical protein
MPDKRGHDEPRTTQVGMTSKAWRIAARNQLASLKWRSNGGNSPSVLVVRLPSSETPYRSTAASMRRSGMSQMVAAATEIAIAIHEVTWCGCRPPALRIGSRAGQESDAIEAAAAIAISRRH